MRLLSNLNVRNNLSRIRRIRIKLQQRCKEGDATAIGERKG